MTYLTVRSNLEAVVGEGLKADVEVRSETLGNELGKQVDLIEGFVLGETIENGVKATNDQHTAHRTAIQQELTWQAAQDDDPLVRDVLNNPVAKELYEFLQRFPAYTNLLLTDQYGPSLPPPPVPQTITSKLRSGGRQPTTVGRAPFTLVNRRVEPCHAHPERDHCDAGPCRPWDRRGWRPLCKLRCGKHH
jgi:hypothetical protein